MDLRNVGILPQHYTASQRRRPQPETSLSWKPPNSYLPTYLPTYLPLWTQVIT